MNALESQAVRDALDRLFRQGEAKEWPFPTIGLADGIMVNSDMPNQTSDDYGTTWRPMDASEVIRVEAFRHRFEAR